MARTRIFVGILLFALLSASAPAHAVVERECIVALQARSGWSKAYRRTVYFMTGLELSRITSVLKIEFGQVYAVITHERGLPNVVRLDMALPGVRREFTAADFVRLFIGEHERLGTQLEGEGRNLKWRLRGRTNDAWVDDAMPALGMAIQ